MKHTTVIMKHAPLFQCLHALLDEMSVVHCKGSQLELIVVGENIENFKSEWEDAATKAEGEAVRVCAQSPVCRQSTSFQIAWPA